MKVRVVKMTNEEMERIIDRLLEGNLISVMNAGEVEAIIRGGK